MAALSYNYDEDAMLDGILKFKAEERAAATVRSSAVRTTVVGKLSDDAWTAMLQRHRSERIEMERQMMLHARRKPAAIAKYRKVRVTNQVIEVVAQHFKLAEDEVLSDSHEPRMAQARHMVALILRNHQCLSLVQIGKLLGRHHTTVRSGLNKARYLCAASAEYQAAYEAILAKIAP